MPIRRAVNSTRETPPKSKLAEGEEEKPGKVKQPQFKKTKPLQFSLNLVVLMAVVTCLKHLNGRRWFCVVLDLVGNG